MRRSGTIHYHFSPPEGKVSFRLCAWLPTGRDETLSGQMKAHKRPLSCQATGFTHCDLSVIRRARVHSPLGWNALTSDQCGPQCVRACVTISE